MKNIFNKLSFHPLMFLFLFIVLITGNFKKYLLFLSIIFVHEMGHILFALLFKWQIEKINILPFGMITNFQNCLNKPIYQELIILVMGPIFQIIFYYYTHNPYHCFLLFINLLPIYPLDGSKLCMLILNKIETYYKSYIMVFAISFITIILTFYYGKLLIIYLMLIYLTIHLVGNIKSINDILISFCYDRYINKIVLKKSKTLKSFNIKNLYRDRYHFFKYGNKVVSEDEIFAKMFDKTG